MSVEPGFGGQAFIPESLDKIRKLRKLLDERNLPADLEVDGGIYPSNVAEVLEAGGECDRLRFRRVQELRSETIQRNLWRY